MNERAGFSDVVVHGDHREEAPTKDSDSSFSSRRNVSQGGDASRAARDGTSPRGAESRRHGARFRGVPVETHHLEALDRLCEERSVVSDEPKGAQGEQLEVTAGLQES